MSGDRPITIVGGGLAGLTLGIALRQRDVPVTLWEAGRYPRHRVCGEFISGRGQQVLARLGLGEILAGAVRAQTAVFFAGRNRSPIRALPEPALCLSRHALDHRLAGEFHRLGGDLRENARWPQNDFPEGVVRATGRRPQPQKHHWRWFGLKAHGKNIPLAADLEMHVSHSGYVGVNRINGGEVNVCGLFRARPGGDRPDAAFDRLRGETGSPLRERLAGVQMDEASFCSVAGLSLAPHRAVDRKECCVGDTLTMIPPVTGNGMSMAFESAELAVAPLLAYSRENASWPDAQRSIARACDAAFSGRLRWARRLQRLMLSPLLQSPIGSLVLRSEWLWQFMFTRTR